MTRKSKKKRRKSTSNKCDTIFGANKVYCMCKPISNIREKTAQDLIEYCGQTEYVPIDLRAMLTKLQISCLSRDFSEIEKVLDEGENNPILGALVTNGDNAVIYIRQQDKENSHRYRFTIAHELAHACLGHYPIGKTSVHLRREISGNDQQEYAANVFAGQLLIPQKTLERVISELLFPSVQILAEVFEVSENVMKARLDQLEISRKIVGYN